MRSPRAVLVAALFAVLWMHAVHADPPALSELMARAGAYALRYEQQFAAVISDEAYEQKADGRSYRGQHQRKMSSEMMFLWLSGENAWLSVRNVVSVDGGQIKNSTKRLDRLLSESAPIGVAHLRRMRDEGARFNIGTIRRNFNDPMFPLQFLEPQKQPRFAFTETGDETVDGIATTKVAFVEQAQPTFIQDGHRNLPAHGILWIADDGRILRTRLDVSDPERQLRAILFVNYRPEPKLEMLVPMTMREMYIASGANAEHVECDARYSNFRRFETAARIVPDR